MTIDEKHEFPLTNFRKTKNKQYSNDSDHFSLLLEMNLKIENTKEKNVLIINYNDEAAKLKFKELTDNTIELTECFEGNATVEEKAKQWKETLLKIVNMAFKKIRIRKKTKKQIKQTKLIQMRNKLKRLIKYKEFQCDDCGKGRSNNKTLVEHTDNKIQNSLTCTKECECKKVCGGKVSFSEPMQSFQLVRGLADQETQERILSEAASKVLFLFFIFIFINQQTAYKY